MPHILDTPRRQLAGSWAEYALPDGTGYFYNVETGVSSWQPPPPPPAQQQSPAPAVQEDDELSVGAGGRGGGAEGRGQDVTVGCERAAEAMRGGLWVTSGTGVV